MKVPDRIRKCVGFVGHRDQDGTASLHGTFFVMSVKNELGRWAYAVTAAHVLVGMRNAGYGSPWLRINTTHGVATWIERPYDDWGYDLDNDIAVCGFPTDEDLDYGLMTTDLCLTPERIAENLIGPGDEVFITGLFLLHDDPTLIYGRERNIPIVRAGHIAAMPGEPVPTAVGDLDAYLVEARSLGGVSGAPVFVHLGLMRLREGKVEYAGGNAGIFYLMGFVHGHFPVRDDSQDTTGGKNRRDLNMGIAVVVPIERVVENLTTADMDQGRRRAYEEMRSRSG